MKKLMAILLLVVVLLSACDGSQPNVEAPVETPELTETSAPPPEPTHTPTEKPLVTLTVCTTTLPETPFPYAAEGATSPAKERLLSLLYPSAFETGILEKVPAQGDGDLRLEPTPIRRGQTVVDARGELVSAFEGVQVRPSGCRNAECTITWDGVTPLEMDRMVIDFKLRDDLTWSDGTPVSAGDSVFSFRLASDPESPTNGWAEAHTAGYSALDDRTVTWIGYPGFSNPDLERFFWAPLPRHVFGDSAGWAEVAGSDSWTASPLSYGPFFLVEWRSEALGLARNPAYFQVGDGLVNQGLTNQGLPDVDLVIFRLVEGGALEGWEAYQAGACDVLDASFRLEGDPALLAEIDAQAGVDLHVRGGESWTQLVFGVRPAAYDAIENTIFAERPDFFGDVRVRQAIAICVDRQAMLAVTLGARGAPWPSFLPPEVSRLEAGLGITYDPATGAALLAEAGWIDQDGDPATPRVSQNAATVFNGIPLSLELLVDPSAFHQDLAGVIQESLGACGVGVDVRTLPPAELYAPGPEGPLFGRGFDLALIAWQPLPTPDCGLYVSWGIPTEENGWIGTNVAGLADAAYDQACSAAGLALPDESDVLLAEAEAAFVDALPAVPLVAPPVIEVWRVDSE